MPLDGTLSPTCADTATPVPEPVEISSATSPPTPSSGSRQVTPLAPSVVAVPTEPARAAVAAEESKPVADAGVPVAPHSCGALGTPADDSGATARVGNRHVLSASRATPATSRKGPVPAAVSASPEPLTRRGQRLR